MSAMFADLDIKAKRLLWTARDGATSMQAAI